MNGSDAHLLPGNAELIQRLNEPELYYPGNFDTPRRANALLSGLCQEAEDALESADKRIAELEAEVDHLYQVCRDAYEVWAGSDGIPEPITCVEAYLLQLLIAMHDEVKRGLK